MNRGRGVWPSNQQAAPLCMSHVFANAMDVDAVTALWSAASASA